MNMAHKGVSPAAAGARSGGYHHGELPATLMTLAAEHIAARGTEKLSLRALAREAGVSPTAPYRHFQSKQCLLAAIATQGFDTLHDEYVGILVSDRTLEEQAVAMAMAYIRFAAENPVSYQLMFGSVLGDFSHYEMLRSAAAGVYEEVDQMLHALIAAKGLDVDAAQLGGAMWSFLHGLSSLLINEPTLGPRNSKLMLAINAVRDDPQAALRLIFGELIATE